MLKCLPAGGCHVRRGTAVITGGPRLRQDIYHHPEDPVSDPGTPDHPGEASGDHLYQRSGSIHEAALCADISTGSAYRQFWNISFCFLSNPAPVGQNFIRQYFKRQTKKRSYPSHFEENNRLYKMIRSGCIGAWRVLS